jgi:Nucleotide modification associated domain 1
MTMSWTDYDEKSWEYQAGHALTAMKCDGPFKSIKPSLVELYESDQFDALARKAMHELNKVDSGSWTLDYQVELLASKQHDYGHANIEKFGAQGVRVRLWDKISRFENLRGRGYSSMNESVVDTLKDIIGYCAIYMMVKNGTFSFPLEAELEKA